MLLDLACLLVQLFTGMTAIDDGIQSLAPSLPYTLINLCMPVLGLTPLEQDTVKVLHVAVSIASPPIRRIKKKCKQLVLSFVKFMALNCPLKTSQPSKYCALQPE